MVITFDGVDAGFFLWVNGQKVGYSGNGRAITSVKVDGKENKVYFVSHDLFRNGGKVEINIK